jgi:hypothetical protein
MAASMEKCLIGPMERAGVNITVLSYADSVDFGVVACERSVPHVGASALGFRAVSGPPFEDRPREDVGELVGGGEGATPDPTSASATGN